MLRYKKAEVGETMTWMVATIIIVVVLIIFLYTSHLFGSLKSASIQARKFLQQIDFEKELEADNWIEVKTNIAFSKNPSHRAMITKWIGEKK